MNRNLGILILEDVPADAELIQFELKEAGISFTARWVQDRASYLNALDELCPDVILSDYSLPSFDGISALKLAGEKCPEVPFIFVSGALGEEKAIELLKQGATDYVLKSRLSRLEPAVSRALQEAKTLKERKMAEEALRKSEKELRIQAQNLMEVNTTMKVLLNAMEKDQEELKERILTNIKEEVLPYLEKLKKKPLQDVEMGLVQMAEIRLNEIASPFVQKLTSSYLNLTKKEIQIAKLVKDGKTSKEMAQILDSSQRVIEFHRENIRRKLGLKKKKGSLAILLRSFS